MGSSAHSYFKNQRYSNISNIDKYVLDTLKGISSKVDIEAITLDRQILEYILLHLRLLEGINFDKFKKRFNLDFSKKYSSQIQNLLNLNLITIDSEGLKLTLKGIDLESVVSMEFI